MLAGAITAAVDVRGDRRHVAHRAQRTGVYGAPVDPVGVESDALGAGDTLHVGMSDGTTRTFVIDRVRESPKVDLRTGDIFRTDGDARLALITCGGALDPSGRHDLDDLVVLATPTG